jgi:rhodanese-related sulfurtransferase
MKTTILILALSIFAFTACQTASKETAANTTETAAAGEIKHVSVQEARNAVSGSGIQFIDVRAPEEFQGSHAAGAVNFPLETLESDFGKLDKEKPVYVICQSGARSKKGAEILQKAGFKEIYNVAGGTTAWSGAGLEVEKSR